MLAEEGVAVYKATKECHNDWMQYVAVTYLVGKNEIWSKVAIFFTGLDLTFFDMEPEELDDSAPGFGDAAGSSGDADPPLVATRSTVYFYLLSFVNSFGLLSCGPFCNGLRHFEISMKFSFHTIVECFSFLLHIVFHVLPCFGIVLPRGRDVV